MTDCSYSKMPSSVRLIYINRCFSTIGHFGLIWSEHPDTAVPSLHVGPVWRPFPEPIEYLYCSMCTSKWPDRVRSNRNTTTSPASSMLISCCFCCFGCFLFCYCTDRWRYMLLKLSWFADVFSWFLKRDDYVWRHGGWKEQANKLPHQKKMFELPWSCDSGNTLSGTTRY